MIEVENILFDFNGTIVNDLELCIKLLNTMLIKRNHAPVSKEQYLEIFDFPVIEYYKKAGFVFPQDDFDDLAQYFIKEYTIQNPSCPLNKGVKEMLDFFKDQNKHLFIVSASEINLLKNQLKIYGIDQYFEGVSGLDNINASSKIESAKAFIKNQNLDLNKTVFIGDTLHDAEVAAHLGVKCILVNQGHQSRHRLEESGCLVVDSFLDLEKELD